ncbi:hypothetical protein M427DRAFT_401738 [Gonapodya prolifera JEL478]|uniref:Uncharacterized protein n=1 Tax=Gonapodya prolifera (strain JEL478) TaxID=1344416 RepID=A0A139ATM0_GONPJ|nr:hypothetical protein M427DRAFT_401738 [Gonapodya prolifera JEL478]|eukprot:KXS20080.1 hypothetical protein M427DRAFT_401738 [Gonapodya prolifera JEL478]
MYLTLSSITSFHSSLPKPLLSFQSPPLPRRAGPPSTLIPIRVSRLHRAIPRTVLHTGPTRHRSLCSRLAQITPARTCEPSISTRPEPPRALFGKLRGLCASPRHPSKWVQRAPGCSGRAQHFCPSSSFSFCAHFNAPSWPRRTPPPPLSLKPKLPQLPPRPSPRPNSPRRRPRRRPRRPPRPPRRQPRRLPHLPSRHPNSPRRRPRRPRSSIRPPPCRPRRMHR